MKVIATSRSDQAVEDCDYRGAVHYDVYDDEGKEIAKAHFSDGEPEDSNLCRDFSDVYSIPELMQRAYEAGKNGEEFIWEDKESDDI
jgi:hypothetical protein